MKLNLIYYKCIVDMALEELVNCCGDMFTRENGKYVLGLNISKKRLEDALEKLVDKEIRSIVEQYSKDDVFLVIGSCYPKDNLLLALKDNHYFPSKLSKLIDNKPALKWLLAEKDIEIDIDLFNELFIKIFNKKFGRKEPKRSSNIKSSKVVFISHSKLDCYMMFKTIKWAYGSLNCTNVWKDKLSNRRQNLIALNDLVSKYVHNKSRANKSLELKRYAQEVKDFLNKRLGMGV